MVDKSFCMSSYLTYRYVYDATKSFADGTKCNVVDLAFEREAIKNADELLSALERIVDKTTKKANSALALSGGIDSAILAHFMPSGSKAYTFKCVVPGKEVTDETQAAAKWAKLNNLEHSIVEVRWEDVENCVDELMRHKGSPIHSIETQIFLAAKKAKEQGISQMIFGENADIIYGGMDGLLQKDWTFGEFVDRYSYVKPYYVLKNPEYVLAPFYEFEKNGHIDGHDFINKYFRQEALGTYINACNTAGVEFIGPYSQTYLDAQIDYSRIRSGETKYIVREAFKKVYPRECIPTKIPMPRPVNEWFADWEGPNRNEFIPHCVEGLSGNQKWMVWALERFLNLLDER